jgi:hypothetical protein
MDDIELEYEEEKDVYKIKYEENLNFKNQLLKKGMKNNNIMIPVFVYASKYLDPYDKLIYGILLAHVFIKDRNGQPGTGQCNPSKERIQEKCNISISKVRSSLLKLEKEFYIGSFLVNGKRNFEFFTPEIRQFKLVERKKKCETDENNILKKMKNDEI